MSEDVYVFLRPDEMDVEDQQNYHLIEAELDRKTNTLHFNTKRVLCNRWDKKNKISISKDRIFPRNDEDAVRLFLAKQQNSGRKVCANCAKHFYADED